MVSQADYHSAVVFAFDVYDHVDDWHYMGLHDWIKAEKHGITKVVDQACREIRRGRLSRSEAITLKSMLRFLPNAVHCCWNG